MFIDIQNAIHTTFRSILDLSSIIKRLEAQANSNRATERESATRHVLFFRLIWQSD